MVLLLAFCSVISQNVTMQSKHCCYGTCRNDSCLSNCTFLQASGVSQDLFFAVMHQSQANTGKRERVAPVCNKDVSDEQHRGLIDTCKSGSKFGCKFGHLCNCTLVCSSASTPVNFAPGTWFSDIIHMFSSLGRVDMSFVDRVHETSMADTQ